MRDNTGKTQSGPAVMQVMSSHFSELLGGAAELSNEVRNQMEAEVVVFELQHAQVEDMRSSHGDCPTLDEVASCIKVLRNHAASGEDQIDARMLKAGPIVTTWLHRVVAAVWASGKAPAEWKSALVIPLYKGKGARDTAGNYRGISLLSIAGKVYATILAWRVYEQTDEQLHEAQCGFRRGRGTTDAMFSLRSLGQACSEWNVGMAKAYIDFTKAYDSIDRAALWKALKLYGVHTKLITLLEDLHSGNFAAVRLDGKIGARFKVSAGVRQGCVIAPTLFNIFIDLVMKKALARMPPNCGIKLKQRASDQIAIGSLENVVMLMYADDVVLMSHDPSELAVMLSTVDEVANEYGMRINASKTEIQFQGVSDVLPNFRISTGVVSVTQEFKYLGSWVQSDGGMDKEINVRRGRAIGVFQSFEKVWRNRKLKVANKMAIYNSLVLPHFLYGCETWNCSSSHLNSLEVAHSSCLRRILGVGLRARHTMDHVRKLCCTDPVRLMIVKRTFQWLGHVARMPETRLPKIALNCYIAGGVRSRGRPRRVFRQTYNEMLSSVGVADPTNWLADMDDRARDRRAWREVVNDFILEPPPRPAPRRSSRLQHSL
jgi:sorting nexin-29